MHVIICTFINDFIICYRGGGGGGGGGGAQAPSSSTWPEYIPVYIKRLDLYGGSVS